MTYATYGPRVPVHPDRIGGDRSAQTPMVSYLILHTSEQSGAEDVNDAEDLAGYLTSPGDRQGRNGAWGSSYHAITDTDRILPAVDHYRVAYAAGGGNRYGLHLCLPVRAGQTREEWLDDTSTPYIQRAAEWVVDQATGHGIPLEHITAEEMADGASGYADHWTVTRAFGRSTHTDVGAGFPWDVFDQMVYDLANPKDDPMLYPYAERIADTRNLGAVPAGGSTYVLIPKEASPSSLVALKLAADQATGDGFLTAWPYERKSADDNGNAVPRPEVAHHNYVKGPASSTLALVEPGPGRWIEVFTTTECHIIVDLEAFQPMPES